MLCGNFTQLNFLTLGELGKSQQRKAGRQPNLLIYKHLNIQSMTAVNSYLEGVYLALLILGELKMLLKKE